MAVCITFALCVKTDSPLLPCRLSWLPMAALLLGGCVAPPPVALDQHVPAQWAQALPPGPSVDLRQWWRIWKDPALEALVEQALSENLDLRQAVHRLREQRLLSQAGSHLFRPYVRASTNTLQDIAATDTYFHASIDMAWELGLFGQSDANALAQTAAVQQAQAQWQAARVSLVAQVVRHYWDIRAAQHQRSLLEQLNAIDLRTLHLAQVRQAQRLDSSEAVAQAQIQASESRAQLAMVQAEQARAAHGLAVLLGRDTAQPEWLGPAADGVTAGLPSPAVGMPAQLPAELLRSRPDIQVSQAQVYSAAADLGLARSAMYPRLTLVGSLLYSHNVTRNFRTRVDNMPMVGPVFDIPLFDWGQRRDRADAQQQALDAAELAYRQSVLLAVAEVESALAGLAAQRQRDQALGQASAQWQQRAVHNATRVRLGLSSEYAGLAVRRASVLAQSEQATAQAAQALAYVALYKALGGAALPPQPASGETVAVDAGPAP